MTINQEQKLSLFRKASVNPGAAFLEAFNLLSTEIDSKLEVFRKEAQSLVMGDFIKSMKGKDGKDADPKVIAAALAKNADFMKIAKAKDGKTPTRIELVGIVKQLIPKVRNGRDGKDGRNGKDGKTTIGPKGKDGKDGSPDLPIEIAGKLNTLDQKVNMSVIKGLEGALNGLTTSVRSRAGGKAGGGMGNVVHQNFSASSATTTVAVSSKIAAGGNAHWCYYNGQLLFKGTHYTVSSDQKTFTFLFTMQDSSNISILYVRTS